MALLAVTPQKPNLFTTTLVKRESQAYDACLGQRASNNAGTHSISDMIVDFLTERKAPTAPSVGNSINEGLEATVLDCLSEHPLAALSNFNPSNSASKAANFSYPVNSEYVIKKANPLW